MALVALLATGADVLMASKALTPVGEPEVATEEACVTTDVEDAEDEVDTFVAVDEDAEVEVEVGRTLVRVAPYSDLQVSLSIPSGQQSVLLRVPG